MRRRRGRIASEEQTILYAILSFADVVRSKNIVVQFLHASKHDNIGWLSRNGKTMYASFARKSEKPKFPACSSNNPNLLSIIALSLLLHFRKDAIKVPELVAGSSLSFSSPSRRFSIVHEARSSRRSLRHQTKELRSIALLISCGMEQ
jgi:hypothetical protein